MATSRHKARHSRHRGGSPGRGGGGHSSIYLSIYLSNPCVSFAYRARSETLPQSSLFSPLPILLVLHVQGHLAYCVVVAIHGNVMGIGTRGKAPQEEITQDSNFIILRTAKKKVHSVRRVGEYSSSFRDLRTITNTSSRGTGQGTGCTPRDMPSQ